jgi:hypothetical protein
MGQPEFDTKKAHEFFSASCFNGTWALIDKADRTAEDDERMLLSAMASLWHWTNREDHTPTNLSIGYWQVSRVHALLERADEARRYGLLALDAATRGKADAFTRGYAYEALARAEAVAGDRAKSAGHLRKAKEAAAEVRDAQSRQWLLDDLKTIEDRAAETR